MLDFEDDASKREKCYTTIGQLPAFIDPKQPPTKRSPFSAILGHPFVHTVEVILPKDILSHVEPQLQNLRYARVFMSLSSLLEGEFFNTYIKTGILKLELSKEIFERTGLTVVEINLRLPSMLHGKKGFERIVWAFKNVLNQSVAWLFFDLTTSSGGVSEDDPSLKGNHPQIINYKPLITEHSNILVPRLPGPEITNESREAAELEDHCNELSEWLAMVSLQSPRVSVYDDVDPYLCRYSVPDSDNAKPTSLFSLKWHGLVPSRWIIELLVAILKETAPKSIAPYAWFALSASALGREAVEARDGYTVMVLPTHVPKEDVSGVQADSSSKGDGRHFICWEYVGASIL
ncbi:ribonuclease P protein subunit p40 [Aspergillus luchuensis IFO 4308]|nr:ribonuclease P protein subunit p40 [Aspergillus luchuensis IFO 4308]